MTRQSERFSDAIDRVRWVRELFENKDNPSFSGIEPVVEERPFSERWFSGEMTLHLNVGIRPSFLDVDPCYFCVDIQRYPGHLVRGAGNGAIARIGDTVPCVGRNPPEWADRPMLVVVGQTRQKRKAMKGYSPLPSVIRLVPTDSCDVCRASTRQVARQHGIELIAGRSYREVDVPQLSSGEIGVSSPMDDGPGQVVEATAIVGDDVAEQETPKDGHGFDIGDTDDDAVTLSVIFSPKGNYRLTVGIRCVSMHVGFERLGMSYRPAPFEPGAIERAFGTAQPKHSRAAEVGDS